MVSGRGMHDVVDLLQRLLERGKEEIEECVMQHRSTHVCTHVCIYIYPFYLEGGGWVVAHLRAEA